MTSLEAAYKVYKDISSNLEEGIKFYSDLEQVLSTFVQNSRDFASARSVEKSDAIGKITQGFGSMNLQSSTASAGYQGQSVNASMDYGRSAQQNVNSYPGMHPGVYNPPIGLYNSSQPSQPGVYHSSQQYNPNMPQKPSGTASSNMQPGVYKSTQPPVFGSASFNQGNNGYPSAPPK